MTKLLLTPEIRFDIPDDIYSTDCRAYLRNGVIYVAVGCSTMSLAQWLGAKGERCMRTHIAVTNIKETRPAYYQNYWFHILNADPRRAVLVAEKIAQANADMVKEAETLAAALVYRKVIAKKLQKAFAAIT